jgi:hypothetical protein
MKTTSIALTVIAFTLCACAQAIKISQMPTPAASLSGIELVPIVQNGTNYAATTAGIAALSGGPTNGMSGAVVTNVINSLTAIATNNLINGTNVWKAPNSFASQVNVNLLLSSNTVLCNTYEVNSRQGDQWAFSDGGALNPTIYFLDQTFNSGISFAIYTNGAQVTGFFTATNVNSGTNSSNIYSQPSGLFAVDALGDVSGKNVSSSGSVTASNIAGIFSAGNVSSVNATVFSVTNNDRIFQISPYGIVIFTTNGYLSGINPLPYAAIQYDRGIVNSTNNDAGQIRLQGAGGLIYLNARDGSGSFPGAVTGGSFLSTNGSTIIDPNGNVIAPNIVPLQGGYIPATNINPNGITGKTNSTIPANTSIISAWFPFTNTTGGVFYFPLYQ